MDTIGLIKKNKEEVLKSIALQIALNMLDMERTQVNGLSILNKLVEVG